jgi:hypothetical protein
MRLIASVLFLLSGLLVAPAMGNSITVNPGDDVVSEVGAANPGDVVTFAAGTFNICAPVTIPSGVTVQGSGQAPSSSHLIFTLAGGDTNSYAFVIPGNANCVEIQYLDIVSNHGVVQMTAGNAYSNITISNNNIEYGPGQYTDGTLVFGIFGSIPNTSLQIVHNYFHDSSTSNRNWCIWFASHANLDYNTFYNVNDGGQLDDPGPDVSFSYNYGTYLNRMGQEAALQPQSTFKCVGNVFYNYVSPYYNTEGVSIVGVSSAVEIAGNYFSATLAPGSSYGLPDSGGTQRFGYAIEATGQPCTISGNTLIGPWVDYVSSDIPNAVVEGNSVYAYAAWGDFDGEPGPYGYGSIVLSLTDPNSIDRNVNDAPAPPVNTFAGPGTPGSTSNTIDPSPPGTAGSTTLIPAWLSPASVAIWNAATNTLTVTGAASIIADPGSAEPIIHASGSSAVVSFNPNSGTVIHIGGLSLTNGASAIVTSLGAARTVTNFLLLVIGVPGANTAPTLTIDSTSTLDLTNNDMAILYGSGSSPLSAINAQLLAAYDGGLWDKPGLTSSIAKTKRGLTALGFGEASALGLTTFDGLTLGGNAVAVKYTLVGDANLDGLVSLADYNAVLGKYNGAGQPWTGGSFDYSGNVGLADYNTILANYNQTLANVLP